MTILIFFGVENCLFQVVTSLTQPWYIQKCVCCMTLSPSVTLGITDSTKQTSRPGMSFKLETTCVPVPRIAGTNLKGSGIR